MSKFNVGDRVRIKSYEKMLSQYKKDDYGIQLPFSRFDDAMKHLCGRTATICKIDEKNNEKVYLKDWDNDDGNMNWTFSIYMLEKIREYKTINFIDDTMDTSKRILFDIKTCGKNSLDNFKIQNDFYNSIFNKKIFTNKIEEDANVEEMNDLYDMYINGIWKKEEEKDMNKVVNLWYERKRNKIIEKYDELEAEFNTTKYSVVESFNELVQRFNEDLESLYKMDKATEQFVLKENAPNNVVKYYIDYERIDKEFEEEYRNKRDEELKEIKDIKDEVEAQLSLSDDLEYQQEVLKRYNIIDKKTNKIVG